MHTINIKNDMHSFHNIHKHMTVQTIKYVKQKGHTMYTCRDILILTHTFMCNISLKVVIRTVQSEVVGN